MKNKKMYFILSGFALFLIILGILTFFKDRIPKNPAGTVGNTAGNLNNAGYFCESDGVVYFANAFDGGSLYCMDPSESNIRKLGNATVRNLLAGGKFLYYFQTGASGDGGISAIRAAKSFNRCKRNGSDVVGLTRDVVITGQLVDNDLYLLTAGSKGPEFYKMSIDKSHKVLLADYQINPACAVNGTLYYNGTQSDHYLYALDSSTDTASVLWQGNLWYPDVQGDYVYYLDVAGGYRLCRYSLSQDVIEALTKEQVDCFNVGNGYIYYQVNGDSPCLKCMRADGSEAWVIAEGNYTAINMTSQYVYFQEYGNTSSWYHSALGSSGYDEFYGAREAALASISH